MGVERHRRHAVLAALSIVAAAACGGNDRDAADSTAAPPASSTTAALPATTAGGASTAAPSSTLPATTAVEPSAPAADGQAMFGELAWPCGPGNGPNLDDGSTPGVTVDSIAIGTGDDAGYAQSPGLDHEVTDAVNAFAARCNELGGINGRQIQVNYYDAAVVNVAAAMQEACDGDNFFLVGEGWSFDSAQEEIRTGCGLPAVPAFAVSAAFSMARNVYLPVPNPADETPSGIFRLIADLYPDAVKAVATLGGNISSTQEPLAKVRAVAPEFGWEFAGPEIEFDIFTPVTDWTPFVKQIQEQGATMIYWSAVCLPQLQKFAQTAKQNGLDVPIITDANHYEAACAAANTDGALDNVHFRLAFTPFEEAAENPATQDYLDLLQAAGGDVSLLGMQAASSFLLWAQAAAACGSTLTRECVSEQLDATTSWSAGGLHAEGDPGGNHPPSCVAIFKLSGTAYERVTPTDAGTFSCDDAWISKVDNVPALAALDLGEDRKVG